MCEKITEFPVGASPIFKVMEFNPKDKTSRGIGFNFQERGEFGGICTIDPEQVIKCYSFIDRYFTRAELEERCSLCPYAFNQAIHGCKSRRYTSRYPDFVDKFFDLEWDYPSCFVYLISDGEYIKIGVAKNVEARLKDLQVANAKELQLICSFPLKNEKEAFKLEKFLHSEYEAYHIRGEWFNILNYINVQEFKLYSFNAENIEKAKAKEGDT